MNSTPRPWPGALAQSLLRDLAEGRDEACTARPAPHPLGGELACPACRAVALRRRAVLSAALVLGVLQAAPELRRIAESNRVAVLAICLLPAIGAVNLADAGGFERLAARVGELAEDLTASERAAIGELAELLVVATSPADVRTKRDEASRWSHPARPSAEFDS